MRLYHLPASRSTRVRWTLEEIGAPYDLTLLSREEKKESEHLSRHPLGRVPVVDDGVGYVFESAGICLQLADLHPEAGLAPAVGSHDRALLYQWLFFAMTELEPAVLEKFLQAETDPARAAAGADRYRAAAKVVDDALAGEQFIVGGAFSVADVVLGAVLSFGARAGLNDDFANIVAYVERLQVRPAYLRANAAS